MLEVSHGIEHPKHGNMEGNVNINPVPSKISSQKKDNIVSEDATSIWSGRLRRGSQIALSVTLSNQPFGSNESNTNPSTLNVYSIYESLNV